MADDAHLKVKVTASTSEFTAATKQVEHAATHMAESIKESMREVAGPLIALGSIAGLGEAFKEAASAALEYDEQVLQISRTMGITTEAASTLSTAVKMVGGSSEGYIQSIAKLNMNLRTNEAHLVKLGMVTRAANGEMLDQQTMFQNALQTMLSYREGTDRNQFAMYAFGRSAQEVSKFLLLNDEVMQQAKEITQSYGLAVGKDAALASEEFGIKLRTAGVILDAIKVQVGNALLPVLVDLAGWFGSVAPTVIKIAVTATKGLIHIFETVILIIRDIYNTGELVFRELGSLIAGVAASVVTIFTSVFQLIYDAFSRSFSGIVEVMTKLLHGDLSGAWEALKTGASETVQGVKANFKIGLDATKTVVQASAHDMTSAWKDYSTNVVKYHEEAQARVDRLWAGSADKLKGHLKDPIAAGTKAFVSPMEVKGAKTSPLKDHGGQVEAWREQLAQMKDAEGSWLEFSKARELAFWQEKLALTKQGSAEYISVFHEVAALKKAVAKQEYDESIAQLNLRLSGEQKSGTERIAVAQQIADKMAETYGAQSVQAQQALQHVQAETRAHNEALKQLESQRGDIEQQSKQSQLDIQQAELSAQVSAGEITKEQQIAQLRTQEEDEYALKLAGLKRRQALAAEDALEQARLDKEIEALHGQHAVALIKLDQQLATAQQAEAKAAAAEAARLDEVLIQTETQTATHRVELAQASLQQRIALGQTSRTHEVEQLRALEQQKYDIAVQGLVNQKTSGDKSVVEQARLDKDLEALGQAHALALIKLDQELALEEQAQAKATAALQVQQATNRLSLLEATMQQQVEFGEITKTHAIEQARDLEQQKYQLALQGLEQQLTLAGKNTLAVSKVNADIEALTQRHNLTMAGLAKQRAQAQEQVWSSLIQPTMSAMDQMTIGIIRGNQTALQAVRNFGVSVVSSYADMVAKMLLHWMIGQMTQTEIQQAEELKRLALSAASAAEGLALQAVTALKSIASAAATAAAWMFADVAAESGPAAPVAAPAAAATALSFVMGLGGLVASAAGGWVVPTDTLAQVHANEMILPADLSKGMQGLVRQGGSGDTHLHVHAVDAESVQRLFESNGSVLAAVLQQQLRDYRPIPRGGRPGGGWSG